MQLQHHPWGSAGMRFAAHVRSAAWGGAAAAQGGSALLAKGRAMSEPEELPPSAALEKGSLRLRRRYTKRAETPPRIKTIAATESTIAVASAELEIDEPLPL
jgi:hypothetical protein